MCSGNDIYALKPGQEKEICKVVSFSHNMKWMKNNKRNARPGRIKLLPFVGLIVGLGLMLAAGGHSVFAQESDDKRVKVRQIAVQGTYLVPARRVVSRLDVSQGERILLDSLRKRAKKITEWGGFGPVQVQTSPAGKRSVDVKIEVKERVQVEGLEFVGNQKVSARRLRTIAGVRNGDQLTPSGAKRAERSITEAYEKMQHPLASVTATARFPDQSPEATLRFGIVEGPTTYVERIRFHGNTVYDDGALKDVMQTGERSWLSFIWSGAFNERAFLRDVGRVEKKYYNAGYLDTHAGGYWTYLSDFSGLVLHISVFEGKQYRVGDISFDGNEIYTDQELRDAVPLEENEVFRPPVLAKSSDVIKTLYGEQGYMQVREKDDALKEQLIFNPDGREGVVDVRFEITEGAPTYIRRIRVEGLTRSDELLVLRNLTIEPGDRADVKEFKRSESRLRDTGYFDGGTRKPVEVKLAPERSDQKDEEEDLPGIKIPTESELRDAVVEVKEGKTGRMMFGAGVSSEDGLLGQFSLTESNFDASNWPTSWRDIWKGNAFRGAGQKLKLRVSLGTESSTYLLSFANPSINNSDIGYNARIARHTETWEEFDLTRTGFELGLTQSEGTILKRGVSVGFESIEMSDLDDDAPPEIRRDDDTFSKPYVAASISRDTRDSTRLPTRGYFAKLRGEVGFADIETVKLVANASHYWTVLDPEDGGPHVLKLRGRAGVIDSWADERIPVFERFYAGGMHSLRGFEPWGVSPVEPVDEDQVGGESMLMGTVEYSLPIFMEDFRIAGFLDAGYVDKDAVDVFTGWDKLRVSPGVGIRWNIPAMGGLPIRVDLAVPVVREDYDNTRNVHFSLGAGYRF